MSSSELLVSGKVLKQRSGSAKLATTTKPRSNKPVSRTKQSRNPEVYSRIVPDYIQPDADVLIIGYNPGYFTALTGHHYGSPHNHFWPCMQRSGLVPSDFGAAQDHLCPGLGIGLTNIVRRVTDSADELNRIELLAGVEELKRKISHFKSKIVVFNGKGIYEKFISSKKVKVGVQPHFFNWETLSVEKLWASTNVTEDDDEAILAAAQARCGSLLLVMPSSSPRTASYPTVEHKMPFFNRILKLKQLLVKDTDASSIDADEGPDSKTVDPDMSAAVDALQECTSAYF